MQPRVLASFFLGPICKLPLPVISDDFLPDPDLISYSMSYYVSLHAVFFLTVQQPHIHPVLNSDSTDPVTLQLT